MVGRDCFLASAMCRYDPGANIPLGESCGCKTTVTLQRTSLQLETASFWQRKCESQGDACGAVAYLNLDCDNWLCDKLSLSLSVCLSSQASIHLPHHMLPVAFLACVKCGGRRGNEAHMPRHSSRFHFLNRHVCGAFRHWSDVQMAPFLVLFSNWFKIRSI